MKRLTKTQSELIDAILADHTTRVSAARLEEDSLVLQQFVSASIEAVVYDGRNVFPGTALRFPMQSKQQTPVVLVTMKIMSSSPSEESLAVSKLKLDKKFQPCHVEEGDEAFRNGIFEFNITRLLAFIDDHAERFPIELIILADIPAYDTSHLDAETIDSADPLRPIVLAEIAPGRYNVIDGNHRIAKARRDRATNLPARKVGYLQHINFLTSKFAYEKYVEYWNSKLKERLPLKARRSGFFGPRRSKSPQ